MVDGKQLFEEFDPYQLETARTDSDYSHISPKDVAKLVHALGVTGEAGELADYIKKCIAHGHTDSPEKVRAKITKEAGDILWYLARILSDFGIKMSDAATDNVIKLRIRYPEGFNPKDSEARVDLLETGT